MMKRTVACMLAFLAIAITGCSGSNGTAKKADEAKETTTMEESAKKYDYTTDKVMCDVGDGRNIYGVLYRPKTGEDEAQPIVIVSHGYTGDLTYYQYFQKYMATKGVQTYAFDYCGGSKNSKSDSDMTKMTVMTEKEELEAVVKMFQDDKRVDKNKIYIIGHSQGGHVATLVTNELQDQIAGLYLIAPAFHMNDAAHENFKSVKDIPETFNVGSGVTSKKYWKVLMKYDIFDKMTYKGHVVIFHSHNDEAVDYSYSEKAVKTFPDAELITMDEQDHNFDNKGFAAIGDKIVENIK